MISVEDKSLAEISSNDSIVSLSIMNRSLSVVGQLAFFDTASLRVEDKLMIAPQNFNT